jgi:ketosteroid isomerase-like protein
VTPALRARSAIAGAVLIGACSGGTVSPGVSPELKHTWEVAFNRGDSAAVAALYSPDAALIMSGAAPVKGPAAIRAVIDAMVKSKVKVRIGSEQNVGSGELAYVYGPYSVFDHDGGQVIESGTYLEVWRRRGGTWQIDLDLNAVGPATAAGSLK